MQNCCDIGDISMDESNHNRYQSGWSPAQPGMQPPFQPNAPFESTPSNKSSYPTIAGILLLLAGALGIISGIYYAYIGSIFTNLMDYYPDITTLPEYENITISTPGFYDSFGIVQGIFIICGVIVIIFSIFALIGGLASIKRKMWGLALACAVLGLFSIGFIFISSILSLIALILIAISKKEFETESMNQQQY